MRRRRGAFVLATLGVAGGLLAQAPPAGAHPLGNFTVNVYTGLRVQPDRLDIDLVVDMAEIPTFQARRAIDTDGDGQVTDAEGGAYATSACSEAAGRVDVSVGGGSRPVRPGSGQVTFPPGTAGLDTLRLTCALAVDIGELREDRALVVRNRNYEDRVGWREMAAVGDRATLVASDVGPRSISERLVAYPDDLLQSPPDQRAATLRARPGGPAAPRSFGPEAPILRSTPRGVDRATRSFTELVGRQQLTPALGLAGMLLSVLLGAVHALAPGHGKTVMAAYLVGRRGSLRQAALIGVTVTAAHTTGVLVLGLVLSASTSLAPERIYPWLGLTSGLMLVAIGAGLLRGALRRRSATHSQGALVLVGAAHGHGHGHSHDHHDHHGHGHGHGDGDGHGHGHGELGPEEEPLARRNLVALGLAGGMVPSPSALVVLLGAIALDRAWYGVALVVGYGLGMAATLTGAGLLLVRFRGAIDRRRDARRSSGWAVVARTLPVLTAALILGVGALLSIRAAVQL